MNKEKAIDFTMNLLVCALSDVHEKFADGEHNMSYSDLSKSELLALAECLDKLTVRELIDNPSTRFQLETVLGGIMGSVSGTAEFLASRRVTYAF